MQVDASNGAIGANAFMTPSTEVPMDSSFGRNLPRRARTFLVLACATALTAIAASAGTAVAATCRTRAHAYITVGSTMYWSGYEDDPVNVPTWNTFDGELHKVGGNGIKPGTQITFRAYKKGTQEEIALSSRYSRTAGDNCVANEAGPFKVTAPPGEYEIVALFFGGNTGAGYNRTIVNVVVR
jgi:hypothetical protein